LNERQEASERHQRRLTDLGNMVKVTRIARIGGRRQLADQVGRPDLIDEALIRSIEEGRDTGLNPELVKPVLAALGIGQRAYLAALGFDPW
jgi:hypothetical protein